MTKETYPQPGKFIDPLSDYGFRYYFDSEPNKEILIEFLNDLFEGEKHIETLERGPTEHDGDSKEDKRVIFDLHCRGSNGEYFIIEMQRIRQEYFKDRALYYTSRLIQRQLPKGKAFNSYQLPEVFLIAFLEFRMEDKQWKFSIESQTGLWAGERSALWNERKDDSGPLWPKNHVTKRRGGR